MKQKQTNKQNTVDRRGLNLPATSKTLAPLLQTAESIKSLAIAAPKHTSGKQTASIYKSLAIAAPKPTSGKQTASYRQE